MCTFTFVKYLQCAQLVPDSGDGSLMESISKIKTGSQSERKADFASEMVLGQVYKDSTRTGLLAAKKVQIKNKML